ncbi:MAG: maleylpyruvate isomerase N-terminal domain-containing protein [Candidatus Limnocylindria bacterium]
MSSGPRVGALLEDLDRQRTAFVAALDAVGPRAGRRILESWDGRDLVFHVAYWSDHGANAVRLAATGRGGSFDYDSSQTDAINARATLAGRALSLEQARTREGEAYARLRAGLAALDDGVLDEQLGNGDLVEDVVRYDGPDHYAEHAGHLRTVLG